MKAGPCAKAHMAEMAPEWFHYSLHNSTILCSNVTSIGVKKVKITREGSSNMQVNKVGDCSTGNVILLKYYVVLKVV